MAHVTLFFNFRGSISSGNPFAQKTFHFLPKNIIALFLHVFITKTLGNKINVIQMLLINTTIQIIPTNKYIYGFYNKFFFLICYIFKKYKIALESNKSCFYIIPPNSFKSKCFPKFWLWKHGKKCYNILVLKGSVWEVLNYLIANCPTR